MTKKQPKKKELKEQEYSASSIEVLESGDVKISWGFDIYSYFVVKDQIVIAFEAYYK